MPRKHSVVDRLVQKVQEGSDTTPTQNEKHFSGKQLQGSQTGKPAKKRIDYWGILLAAILLGGMFFGLFMEAGTLWLRAQLPKHGMHTTGTVIEHQIHISRGPDYYFITSEYDAVAPSGKTRHFTQEHSGSEEQYQQYPPGSSIPLIYLPLHPQTSDISGNETELINDKWYYDNFRRALLSMGGPVLIVAAIQLIRGYFIARRKAN